jgi:hypothetical protein
LSLAWRREAGYKNERKKQRKKERKEGRKGSGLKDAMGCVREPQTNGLSCTGVGLARAHVTLDVFSTAMRARDFMDHLFPNRGFREVFHYGDFLWYYYHGDPKR